MRERRARSAWRAALLCGVAVLVLAAGFGAVLPTTVCGGDLPAGTTPLLAFQLARDEPALTTVFGSGATADERACRERLVAALDRADWIDLLGFIPTYTAFLGFWLAAVLVAERGAPARIARVGIAALAAAASFDVLETSTQLRITHELPAALPRPPNLDDALHLLRIGSVGKFAGLAVVAACAGLAIIGAAGAGSTGRRRAAAIVLASACLGGAALAALGLVLPGRAGLLGAGNALAWLAMLAHAGAAALRRPRRD